MILLSPLMTLETGLCGNFNLHIDNQNDTYIDILENSYLINKVNSPTSIGGHIMNLLPKPPSITAKTALES